MPALSDGSDSVVQALRSGLGIHAAVNEAHEIREVVVSKKSNHFAPADTHAQWRIKFVSVGRHTGAVAPKSHSKRVPENSLVRSEPFESEFGRDRQGLLGNRTLRRPQSIWSTPEYSLMIPARAYELLACILRMAKRRHRQRRPRIGDTRNVAIAQQWKDRMIKRRR